MADYCIGIELDTKEIFVRTKNAALAIDLHTTFFISLDLAKQALLVLNSLQEDVVSICIFSVFSYTVSETHPFSTSLTECCLHWLPFLSGSWNIRYPFHVAYLFYRLLVHFK